MSYEINYNKITDEFSRREYALASLKDWLGGQEVFEKHSRTILADKKLCENRQFMAQCVSMFLGVSGYPVEVWLDYLGFPKETPNNPPATAETQANTEKVG